MKSNVIALAAASLTMTGPAASAYQPDGVPVAKGTTATAAQAQRHQRADVQMTVTDAAGRTITPSSIPPQERRRMTSLQSSLQQWGDQQSQRVTVTIHCSYPPLRCEITISF